MKDNPTSISTNEFRRLYCNDGLSFTGMSKKLGIPRITIYDRFVRDEIPRRSWGGTAREFISEPSEALGYVLGAMKGDGTATKYGRSHKIVLSVRDFAFAESFKNALPKIGLHPSFWYREKQGLWVVSSNHKKFYYWYKDLSIDRIADLLVERRNAVGFIRGFYEAEGCLYKRKGKWYSLQMSNTERSLLELVKCLLLKLNFDFKWRSVTKPLRRKIYILELHRQNQVMRFLDEISPCIKNISRED